MVLVLSILPEDIHERRSTEAQAGLWGGHISPELHRQMKIYSATHGMRLCDVLSLAIEHFLTSSSKTPD